jgi:hypothetical protein
VTREDEDAIIRRLEAMYGEAEDNETKEALFYAIEALKTETKKCPICGSDLYEHCGMCCYEGEKVTKNESDHL